MQNSAEPYLLQQRRKFPRVCLLAEAWTQDAVVLAEPSAHLLWPDRSTTDVLDLSLTGVVLRHHGKLKEQLAKAKVGNLFSVTLRFNLAHQEERLNLDLRLLRKDAGTVGARIESLSSEGRLRLHQDFKDQLIGRSFQAWASVADSSEQKLQLLAPEFSSWRWYHSAFDTNLLIQRQGDEVKGIILEYDTLILRFDELGVRLRKSFAMVEAGQSYSYFWSQESFSHPTMKVSMGTSWSERLKKILAEAPAGSGPDVARDLRAVNNLLQATVRS